MEVNWYVEWQRLAHTNKIYAFLLAQAIRFVFVQKTHKHIMNILISSNKLRFKNSW